MGFNNPQDYEMEVIMSKSAFISKTDRKLAKYKCEREFRTARIISDDDSTETKLYDCLTLCYLKGLNDGMRGNRTVPNITNTINALPNDKVRGIAKYVSQSMESLDYLRMEYVRNGLNNFAELIEGMRHALKGAFSVTKEVIQ